MNSPMDSLEIVLFFCRFIIGSSLLLGSVRLVEKLGFLANRDLADLVWKVAIVASFLLLLPASNLSSSKIVLDYQTSSYLQSLFTQEQVDISSDPTEWLGNSNLQPTNEENTNSDIAIQTELTSPLALYQQAERAQPFAMFLVIAGLVTVLVLFSLVLTYYATVRWLGPRQRLESEHRAFRILFEICDKAGIKKIPYFTKSKRINSPLCFPTGEICFPLWALDSDLPELELRSLIAHEVAHLKRRDPVILLTLHGLTRLFFFQPFFTLAQKRLADLAELAADEWAAGQSENPQSVAEALLTCAKKITSNPQPQWGLAMARDKSKLRARIDRLLDAKKSHFNTTSTWAKAIAVVPLLGLTLSMPELAAYTSKERVKITTKIDFSAQPYHGTFEVIEGEKILGCATGTFVDTPSSNNSILKKMTCESRIISIEIQWSNDTAAPPSWTVSEPNSDFPGLSGSGIFNVITDRTTQSGVETISGEVQFTEQ